MNIENRLRDALTAEGKGAEPTQTKWESVRDRAQSSRARRRAQLLVVGLSAAALIAVIAGVLLRDSGKNEQGLVVPPPVGTGDGPAYVVTAEQNGIFVRSSTDGSVVRELVPGGDAGNLQRVAVSPDGSYVYFERASEQTCEGAGAPGIRSEIVRVPITGGAIEPVTANGSFPTISPSGNYLAYVTDGSQDGCGGTHHLVRQTIGVAESETTISSADTPDGAALFPIAWSSDETVMLASTPRVESQGAGPMLFTIEGLPDSPRVDGFAFPRGSRGQQTPAVILGPRTAAAYVGDAIVSFDTETREIKDRLFELPRRPENLEVDASGKRFLATVEAPDGYTIYRWDVGGGLKSLGNTRVRDLAWARGPVAAPKHFAAVTRDGTLQIRETASGDVVRTLREEVDVSGGAPRLSVPKDGQYVYMDDGGSRSALCINGTDRSPILRIDTSSGEIDEVATGYEPEVSPDGNRLTYVTGRCDAPQELVVRELTSGQERRWTSRSGSVAGPRWSPDGRMIVVNVAPPDGGELETRLLDTVEPKGPTLDDADVIARNNYGYIDEDELLAIRAPEDATVVVTVNVLHGEQRRFLVRQPGVHSQIDLRASSDGEHVMYLLRSGDDFAAFRYSVGATQSHLLANDVVSVAWLERGPRD